jgi:phage terminase large subunit
VHENCLYVEHEAYKIGCDIDHTAELFDTIPGFRGGTTIRADSARPETISFLNRHGYPNVVAAEKGPGSVEDGVAFLRSFERIVIHPRCKHTADEARMYRYKTDRLTDAVLTDIVDANNHCIDALRYALEPLARSRNMGIFNYYREEAARAAQESNSGSADRR